MSAMSVPGGHWKARQTTHSGSCPLLEQDSLPCFCQPTHLRDATLREAPVSKDADIEHLNRRPFMKRSLLTPLFVMAIFPPNLIAQTSSTTALDAKARAEVIAALTKELNRA